LPLPPLDGSSVFSLVLPDRHRARLREVESNPAISMLGLFIA